MEKNNDKDNFEIIKKFGEKILKNSKPIDPEIQKIIDDNWFEML